MARAIRCIGQDDFDLFGDSDRNALMELVHDYFCGDDPEGKPRLEVCQLVKKPQRNFL